MYIAIDVGGTTTRIGASKNKRDFFVIERFKTQKNFDKAIKQIITTTKQLSNNKKIQKLVIAIPGSFNQTKTKRLPNLLDWQSKPLKKLLSQSLKCEVVLANDADAAGIGEAKRGAGKGYKKIAYFTFSTGVGGCHIINNKVTARPRPGHLIFKPNGKKCGCGKRGCFEMYGSGTGFKRTNKTNPKTCKNKKTWAKHAQIVSWGIINSIKQWSPDIIVIGGGLTQVGTLLFKPLRKLIKKPPIKRAKLGDNAGLYGGLELLSAHQFRNCSNQI